MIFSKRLLNSWSLDFQGYTYPSTHSKNMLVKLDHFPRVRGEHKKCLSCHQVVSNCYQATPFRWWKTALFLWWKKMAPRTRVSPTDLPRSPRSPTHTFTTMAGFFWSTKKLHQFSVSFTSQTFGRYHYRYGGRFWESNPPCDVFPYFFNKNNNWKGLTHSMNLEKNQPIHPFLVGK